MVRQTRRAVLRSLGIAGALGIAGVGTASAHGDGAPHTDFRAALTAGHEVAPYKSGATGSGSSGMATFSVNEDGTMDYTLTLKNIEGVVAGHIHVGSRDENGGVVAPLFSFSSPKSGTPQGPLVVTGTVSDTALVQQIVDNPRGYYVNVHTTANPDGEVRGQMTPTG